MTGVTKLCVWKCLDLLIFSSNNYEPLVKAYRFLSYEAYDLYLIWTKPKECDFQSLKFVLIMRGQCW